MRTKRQIVNLNKALPFASSYRKASQTVIYICINKI
uniref:Uncharacterized protein n=1 Tax=Rhizophora mucronata TaxID=61149 RepID=A0A2P2PFH9_RHIMU